MVRIAVAIPTYHLDLPVLWECLDSIAKQTRLPELVCIQASSCTIEDIRPFIEATFPFLLYIASSAEKAFAAENRNKAASTALANGAEIISFMDSDDLMHPRRLEVLERAFLSDPAIDVLVHGRVHFGHGEPPLQWDTLPEDCCSPDRGTAYFKFEVIQSPFKGIDIPFHRVLFEDTGRGVGSKSGHAGHLTVRAHCFEKFRIDEEALGYEDSLYLSTLLKANYEFGYLPWNLSAYRMTPPADLDVRKADMFGAAA
jgi:hypothetical protein